MTYHGIETTTDTYQDKYQRRSTKHATRQRPCCCCTSHEWSQSNGRTVCKCSPHLQHGFKNLEYTMYLEKFIQQPKFTCSSHLLMHYYTNDFRGRCQTLTEAGTKTNRLKKNWANNGGGHVYLPRRSPLSASKTRFMEAGALRKPPPKNGLKKTALGLGFFSFYQLNFVGGYSYMSVTINRLMEVGRATASVEPLLTETFDRRRLLLPVSINQNAHLQKEFMQQ